MITAKMVRGETGLRFADSDMGKTVARSFPVGALLEVQIRKWSDDRSDRQRRTIHAMWQRCAQYYQTSVDTFKLYWKFEHGLRVSLDEMEISGPPPWPGQWYSPIRSSLNEMHSDKEDKFWFLKSEASYTMAEEREHIDKLIVFCSESDIDIEDILAGMEKGT